MILDDIALAMTNAYNISITPHLVEGTNLWKSWMPDDPDFAVGLYEYPAGPPMSFMGGSNRKWETIKFQIIVRDVIDGYENARILIERFINFFDALDESTISGARYMHIHPQGSPMELEPDSRTRIRLMAEFEVIKEPTAVSSP